MIVSVCVDEKQVPYRQGKTNLNPRSPSRPRSQGYDKQDSNSASFAAPGFKKSEILLDEIELGKIHEFPAKHLPAAKTFERPASCPIEDLRKFVSDQVFPCVGAKSALARDQISFCSADDIRTNASDRLIVEKLQDYASTRSADDLFVSFAVLFKNTPLLSEAEFERFLWERLQALHDEDAKTHEWDLKVSSDPASPHFSMSIGGKGFYVVGLHPGASRSARRFAYPTLIFNLHSQFEVLRETGRYDKIRETILKRDEMLDGSLNPMLARHGQSSEARQYSGRALGENWKCPFSAEQT